MSKPTFEHRHYKVLANILAELKRRYPESAGEWLAHEFADGLKGTNPNFDRDRFINAATGRPIGCDRVR